MSKSNSARLADLRSGALVEPERQPTLLDLAFPALTLAFVLTVCLGAIHLALILPIDPNALLGVRYGP